jgi:hypothetical protein
MGDHILSDSNDAIGEVINILKDGDTPTNVTVSYLTIIEKPNAKALTIPVEHIFNMENKGEWDTPQEAAEEAMTEWATDPDTEDEPTAFAWLNQGDTGYSIRYYMDSVV